MDTRQGTAGTVALLLVVLAGALLLAGVLGLFPTHDPVYRAPTSTSGATTCPAGPIPTTAGVCVTRNGAYVIVP